MNTAGVKHTATKRATAAALLACLLAAVPAFAQTKTVLRISTPAVPEDWHVKMLYVFRDELNKAAPGRFDVQVHHSGTLFRQGAEAVAIPRAGARRESDAARLHRGLPRIEDRYHRRPGQPAADGEVDEVLRGDAADRAHGASRRRAAARDLLEDLARTFRCAQGADEKGGGDGVRIQRRKPSARGKGARRLLSRPW